MKGIVFNLLEESVRSEYGEDTWDALLDAAHLNGAYTSLGTYPDSQLYAIVGAAAAALKLPPEAIVRWFGTRAAGMFAERYPDFFRPHQDTRSFLLTLNDIIHPEVRKLYPGAGVPHFDYQSHSDGRLTMAYFSDRKLCAFAEGLIEGSAKHFGETVKIEQPLCTIRGDSHCVLEIAFEKTRS
ncbi:MAG TPA: heme NO-binding domain-containing protein [Polyangiaceae bacterium]